MIDPINKEGIILFDRNQNQIEEFILFVCSVVGKNAETTARALDRFLQPAWQQNMSPFEYIKTLSDSELVSNIRNCGMGCYNHRAETFRQLVSSGIDLYNCSIEELERIKGIGPKSSRFFVVFSRKNVKNLCILDVHVLKYLRQKGYDVPKNTPSGKKYLEIEQMFLKEVAKQDLSLVEFDLGIWNEMRGT